MVSSDPQPVKVKCTKTIPPPPPTCGPTQILVKKCCGVQECVEKKCFYKGRNYTVGETWRDSEEPCMSFICSPEGIQNETKVCSPQHCPEEDKIWDDHHCCFTCRSVCSCAPVMTSLMVYAEECFSELQVPVCDGLCSSGHRMVLYGDHLNVEQSRRCCKETRSEPRAVTLRCSDQTDRNYTYSHVTRCDCSDCAESLVTTALP
ncbi:hypothetical protein NL108_018589 [Boleophthalmus pectinirostris]|uniref:apomucin-like n=1 Tax=Boleophthalmus pectinirostris TaxID=150288 RepID=UPI00242A89EA|nr:apomucin-like [Boleophthalmus pectinirostris]KAJ0064956.1 hypothetical protein NL108_018589 [Boleophthalmus pectinirostris]